MTQSAEHSLVKMTFIIKISDKVGLVKPNLEQLDQQDRKCLFSSLSVERSVPSSPILYPHPVSISLCSICLILSSISLTQCLHPLLSSCHALSLLPCLLLPFSLSLTLLLLCRFLYIFFSNVRNQYNRTVTHTSTVMLWRQMKRGRSGVCHATAPQAMPAWQVIHLLDLIPENKGHIPLLPRLLSRLVVIGDTPESATHFGWPRNPAIKFQILAPGIFSQQIINVG